MHKITLIIAFLLSMMPILASQNSIKDIEEKLVKVKKFLKQEMDTRKIPGLVFGIFDEDSIVASGAYGLANVQLKVPMTLGTTFGLASITKQFTASAILILQQDGKLKVSDKICKYLEECPDEWSNINIHQLLTHTSGLPGMRKKDGSPNILKEYSGVHQMDPLRVGLEINNWSKEFHFDMVKTDVLQSSPGTEMDYSNVGYFLLGMIIDNISGNYREFLNERIFKPSGMTHTYFQDLEALHHDEADPYTLRNSNVIRTRELYQVELHSAGGAYSNIGDLQKWDAILNTEQILTNESKALLWTEHTLANGHKIQVNVPGMEPFGNGYGWAILPAGDKKVVWHNGSSGTEYMKWLDDKISIVTLTNLGAGNYDRVFVHGMTEGIAQILELYSN